MITNRKTELQRNPHLFTWDAIIERHKQLISELGIVPEKRNINSIPVLKCYDAIMERHEKTKEILSAMPDISDEVYFETPEQKSRIEKVTESQIEYILAHYLANDLTVRQIANQLTLSRITVYEILQLKLPDYDKIKQERQSAGGKYSRKVKKNIVV